jgi:hypothetical protein
VVQWKLFISVFQNWSALLENMLSSDVVVKVFASLSKYGFEPNWHRPFFLIGLGYLLVTYNG